MHFETIEVNTVNNKELKEAVTLKRKAPRGSFVNPFLVYFVIIELSYRKYTLLCSL